MYIYLNNCTYTIPCLHLFSVLLSENIALHSYVLYLCCTMLYMYCTVHTVLVLYCTVLYCPVLCWNVLYCTVLYWAVLNCTLLYCTWTVLKNKCGRLLFAEIPCNRNFPEIPIFPELIIGKYSAAAKIWKTFYFLKYFSWLLHKYYLSRI